VTLLASLEGDPGEEINGQPGEFVKNEDEAQGDEDFDGLDFSLAPQQLFPQFLPRGSFKPFSALLADGARAGVPVLALPAIQVEMGRAGLADIHLRWILVPAFGANPAFAAVGGRVVDRCRFFHHRNIGKLPKPGRRVNYEIAA
jgi:hypothetical protein